MLDGMTNVKASEVLKELKYYIEDLPHYSPDEIAEGIDMAIKLLEQQPIAWIVGKDNCQVAIRNMPVDMMQKICAIIGEEEKQPCEDCVSRENAIKQCGFGMTSLLIADSLRRLPPVTPRTNLAESSQDCISREAAIDTVVFECGEWTGLAKEINKQLRQLSSVTPQPKTGHWIRWYEQKENVGCIEHIPHCKCSECGKEYEPHSSQFVKYCNNCGAKMEVEK